MKVLAIGLSILVVLFAYNYSRCGDITCRRAFQEQR